VARASFTDELRRQMAQARATKRCLSVLLLGGQHDTRNAEWLRQDQHEKMLEKMAEVVSNSVRLGDVVTRYGWDQFAVILPASNLQEAERIEVRLRAALAECDFGAGEGESLIVCTGLAEMCPDDDLVTLARRASGALEQSRATVNAAPPETAATAKLADR
jgi:diguanylate cyclase (GGDEF)-like protein